MKKYTNFADEIESTYIKDNSNLMIIISFTIVAAVCGIIWHVVTILERLSVLV